MEVIIKMTKKFYEADKILNEIEGKMKFTEIDKQYEKIMSEIPNFDKHKDNSIVIYRRGNYIIIKTKKKSYIVITKKKSFKQGHTHTKDFKYSKSLIDLAIRKKLPRKANKKVITSLIRISDDKNYIKNLEEYRKEIKKHE